jgi:hypothetical protein
MSKKTVRKSVKPQGPKPVAKRADAGEAIVLDELEAGPLDAAAVRQSSEPTPPVPTALEEALLGAAPKPLAPLAALWPDSAPSKGESKSLPPPSPDPKGSFAVIAPKSAPPQPPVQPVSPTAPQATAAALSAATTCNVQFELMEPTAKRVALCGEFNHWATHAIPLTRGPDGRWTTAIALTPGRYEYKFLVDGVWIPDPSARENVWNYHGTLNSVIEVRA